MSAPGSSMKFLGVDSNQLDLTEKKSSQRNNLHQYFTASEILSAQSSSTDTDLFFVDAMTTASLNTSTYNNGTGGVGATITADANGALGVVDGYTVVVNDIIAVKNQANGFENGIYEVTTLGDGSNPFVLTRVSYYDATDEVYPSLVTVVNGDTNGSLYYLQTTENPTIGTDSLVFETSTAPVTSSSETQVFFVNTATSANLSGTYADGTDAALPGSGATIKFTGGGVTEVINGVTLVVNDILLVKDQTNAEENGVYRVTKVNNGTGNLKTLTREDVYADNIYPILVHVSDANSDYHKNIYTSTSSSVVVNADVGTENVSYVIVDPYDNSTSGLSATTKQAAIDEVETRVGTNDAKTSASGSVDTHSDVDTSTTPPNTDEVLKWNGANWIPGTTSIDVDVFGIANTSGVYTYYADIAAANTAASSGDTVVFFADITETGTTEFVLKDGVNYNLNGYTYENSNAGANNSVTDDGVAATCSIFNGKIKRSGGTTPALATNIALHIDSTTSEINLFGVHVENSNGVACRNDGRITGGFYKSNYYCFLSYAGEANNISAYSTGGIALYLSNTICQNSYGESATSYGVELGASVRALNCSGYSDGSVGFYAASTSIAYNCSGYSTSKEGFYANSTAEAHNCSGTSTAYWAFKTASGARAYNCVGKSTANYGGNIQGDAFNCTFLSTAADGCFVSASLYDSSVICLWNSASGDAVYSSGGTNVFNCYLEVTHASAYCINGTSHTLNYGQNTFKGATTAVYTTNVTQGQTNTPDTYNNILVG